MNIRNDFKLDYSNLLLNGHGVFGFKERVHLHSYPRTNLLVIDFKNVKKIRVVTGRNNSSIICNSAVIATMLCCVGRQQPPVFK